MGAFNVVRNIQINIKYLSKIQDKHMRKIEFEQYLALKAQSEEATRERQRAKDRERYALNRQAKIAREKARYHSKKLGETL